jgi:hypothetical protein
MNPIDSNLQCPNCHETLRPVELACEACGIRVSGPFRLNEFATLAQEDLHFLRIFVRCEGRIREMEAALGLSYPTIRTRLTELKNKLQGPAPAPEEAAAKDGAVGKILESLQGGEITFAEAMEQIQQSRSPAAEPKSKP